MIPHIIHFCWFGRNPLPNDALRCIDSWRRFFPDYTIKEWNEDNFDINLCPYIKGAYTAKKYAFVSDFARFWIIYNYGGIYFDTDVEVVKPFSDILSVGGFMGYETPDLVNPGLGFAAPQNEALIGRIVEHYMELSTFDIKGASGKIQSVVQHTSEVLKQYGVNIASNKLCKAENITIYPMDWFNPLDSVTNRLVLTENTHSIHWYNKSWIKQTALRAKIGHIVHRVLGRTLPSKVKKIFLLK